MITPEQIAKNNSEHSHQAALFAHIAMECNKIHKDTPLARDLKCLFAIPNGGERNKAVAGKLKAEGVKAGAWDLILPVHKQRRSHFNGPSNVVWHGLIIEMKAPDRRNHKNGGIEDNQIDFGKMMNDNGWALAVCYTWYEAYAVILDYLRGNHGENKFSWLQQ
jgi:hypothetical protein